jgi:hypothetical protein
LTTPSTTVRSVSPDSHALINRTQPVPFTAPSTARRSNVQSRRAAAHVPAITVAPYNSST